MSLETLSSKELDLAGEFFGVAFKKGATKTEKVNELTAEGVTFAEYQKHLVPEAEVVEVIEPVVVDEVAAEPVEEKVLMVMKRGNPTFEIRGYRFTRDHPFQLVLESDANYIMQTEKGFRPAMPAEAREFYG